MTVVDNIAITGHITVGIVLFKLLIIISDYLKNLNNKFKVT